MRNAKCKMKNEKWGGNPRACRVHSSFFIFHSSFPRRRRRSVRGGFTLLEVILSISLATLVMLAIGMAIDAHVTVTTRGRGKIEQAQLARSVFRLIGDDLRNSILYAPLDFSSIANLNLDADVGGGSQDDGMGDGGMGGDPDGMDPGGMGGMGGGKPPGGQTGQGSNQGNGQQNNGAGGQTGNGGNSNSGGASGGNSNSGGSSTGSSSDTGSALDDATTAAVDAPGVYGSAYELEVDISRLPRVDEYEIMVQNGAGAVADVPSDVKTVAYYVTGGASGSAAPGGPTADLSRGGLVRRAVDRAVTKYAYDSGGSGSLEDSAAVLAPEVTSISFSYFDGSAWTDYWDMVEMGAPPLAVEVTIEIASPKVESIFDRTMSSLSGSGGSEAETTVYRQVVYLPSAEGAAASGTESGTEAGMESDATGDTSGTGGTAGTGATP
jgi:type II secretory pathway pseudopilin PulG